MSDSQLQTFQKRLLNLYTKKPGKNSYQRCTRQVKVTTFFTLQGMSANPPKSENTLFHLNSPTQQSPHSASFFQLSPRVKKKRKKKCQLAQIWYKLTACCCQRRAQASFYTSSPQINSEARTCTLVFVRRRCGSMIPKECCGTMFVCLSKEV